MENSDYARHVYEFKEMLRRRYPDIKIRELLLNTREGAAEASLYGIMSYPAVLVTHNDGVLANYWEGLPLPLIDEVVVHLLDSQGVAV